MRLAIILAVLVAAVAAIVLFRFAGDRGLEDALREARTEALVRYQGLDPAELGERYRLSTLQGGEGFSVPDLPNATLRDAVFGTPAGGAVVSYLVQGGWGAETCLFVSLPIGGGTPVITNRAC